METTNFGKRELLQYTGDFSQLLGTRDYTLNGGKAQGVRAIDVRNGAGLEFTVLPDRCLDIAWLSYKGSNMSYISKTGIVAPQYYNEAGNEFLRSFSAGFLTTCGLMNVGTSCSEQGETFGLHGRIANTPGEQVSAGLDWVEGQPVIRVRGKMREGRVFGENLLLSRTITCQGGVNKIIIEDSIENLGFRREPLMLLYHFNLGYPLLDEDAVLYCPVKSTRPRTAEAEKGLDNYSRFQKPTPGYQEQVFFHDLRADDLGNTFVALVNEKLGLGVAIHFNKKQLFNLAQWKMMGEGEYVLGLEPCNNFVNGREEALRQGLAEFIEPGETRNFRIEVEILDGPEQLAKIRQELLQ